MKGRRGPYRSITEPRKLAAALERLDERESRVLELRYGLRGERQHNRKHEPAETRDRHPVNPGALAYAIVPWRHVVAA